MAHSKEKILGKQKWELRYEIIRKIAFLGVKPKSLKRV